MFSSAVIVSMVLTAGTAFQNIKLKQFTIVQYL